MNATDGGATLPRPTGRARKYKFVAVTCESLKRGNPLGQFGEGDNHRTKNWRVAGAMHPTLLSGEKTGHRRAGIKMRPARLLNLLHSPPYVTNL